TSSAAATARTISPTPSLGVGAPWMSDRPLLPTPATAPSRRATTAIVFVLPPSTPSRSPTSVASSGGEEPPGQVALVRGGERGIEAFREIDVEDEGVRAESLHRLTAAPLPGRAPGERLILAQHLDESAHVLRQRRAREQVDAAGMAATLHLDDEVVGKAG